MNTRVMLIDDESGWSQEKAAELTRGLDDQGFPKPEVVWLNPHNYQEDSILIQQVSEKAKSERWDAILIDTNLGRRSSQLPALLLPFFILEAFRGANQSAIGLIYSGTLFERLRELLNYVL